MLNDKDRAGKNCVIIERPNKVFLDSLEYVSFSLNSKWRMRVVNWELSDKLHNINTTVEICVDRRTNMLHNDKPFLKDAFIQMMLDQQRINNMNFDELVKILRSRH